MRANVGELARIAALLVSLRVHIWEVFFLVQVGRGVGRRARSRPASTRTSATSCTTRPGTASWCGRWRRRSSAGWSRPGGPGRRRHGGRCTRRWPGELHRLAGAPVRRPSAHTAATRDGKGIIFIGYDGDVYPAGFLPLALGNVRRQPLRAIYREDPLLLAIRAARFSGRCGYCPYADLCGGSRARAYAASGDPLGQDPACPFQPARTEPVPA